MAPGSTQEAFVRSKCYSVAWGQRSLKDGVPGLAVTMLPDERCGWGLTSCPVAPSPPPSQLLSLFLAWPGPKGSGSCPSRGSASFVGQQQRGGVAVPAGSPHKRGSREAMGRDGEVQPSNTAVITPCSQHRASADHTPRARHQPTQRTLRKLAPAEGLIYRALGC